jgi:hypothetical protein
MILLRGRERNRQEVGCVLHLRPHSCLPHGHAILALAALGRGRLRTCAVPLPGSNQSSIAQLLGTGHLSALHPFSTSSWTRGPFCHHPPKSKTRFTGKKLKGIYPPHIWHVKLTESYTITLWHFFFYQHYNFLQETYVFCCLDAPYFLSHALVLIRLLKRFCLCHSMCWLFCSSCYHI